MYLDLKCTVWERIEFESEEEMNFILEKLKSGEIEHGWEVCEILGKGAEILYDTNEEMTVKENEGFSTLEVYDKDHSEIWNNSNPDI